MIIPTYCPPPKGDIYFRLLKFSRLTPPLKNKYYSEKSKKEALEALNSLSNSINPAIRPFLPLIYHNTQKAGIRDRLDPEVQKLLKDNTLWLIAAEMHNRHWLSKNLKTFQKEKIPVILLKGAAFAGNLYPENAPRLGVDLDLLVNKDNFEPACSLLRKTMDQVLLSSDRVATHKTLFERIFVPGKDKGPTVEIHRGLTNPSIFNINEQDLWTASRIHPAYNSELIRILSPEDTLLHLAVHAFRDLDFCTHNVLDAHEVWCQWKLDLEKLVERADQWAAKKVLYYLLANCREIMETPVPDVLLNRLKPVAIINGANKKILRSTILVDTDHTSLRYRLIQLISQITFPDNITGGLKFQFGYVRTRMDDWRVARKSK